MWVLSAVLVLALHSNAQVPLQTPQVNPLGCKRPPNGRPPGAPVMATAALTLGQCLQACENQYAMISGNPEMNMFPVLATYSRVCYCSPSLDGFTSASNCGLACFDGSPCGNDNTFWTGNYDMSVNVYHLSLSASNIAPMLQQPFQLAPNIASQVPPVSVAGAGGAAATLNGAGGILPTSISPDSNIAATAPSVPTAELFATAFGPDASPLQQPLITESSDPNTRSSTASGFITVTMTSLGNSSLVVSDPSDSSALTSKYALIIAVIALVILIAVAAYTLLRGRRKRGEHGRDDLGLKPDEFSGGLRKVVPMTLSFAGLTYSVTSNKAVSDLHGQQSVDIEGGVAVSHGRWRGIFGSSGKPKLQIIKNVSGYARPGEILAIMGPSGSGKSTLLEVLAHRKGDSDSLQGSMAINSVLSMRSKSSGSNYQRGVGYVTQDDVFIETLTLQETVMIAAELKLPGSMSKAEKVARANEIIHEVGLTHAKNTKVGGPAVAGISGGEKRRLNIALELLSSPSILMLDEPTSGLSASDALTVMGTLKRLSDNGRTVILSIHQPRSEIFNSFDKLMLLSKGQVVFFGQAEAVAGYFGKYGFHCPFGFNLADFLLDVMSVNPLNENSDISKVVASYRVDQDPSKISEDVSRLLNGYTESLPPHQPHAVDPSMQRQSAYAARFSHQVYILLYRNFLNFLRHPAIFWGQFVIHIIFGIISGSIFSGIKTSSNAAAGSGAQFNIGTLLFWMATFCAIMTFSAVPQFILERVQYTREQSSGLYSPHAYMIAKVITETLFFSTNVFVYITITYFWVGLRPGLQYYGFAVLTVIVFVNVALASISAIGAISPNVDVGMALCSLINTFNLLFSGFLVSKSALAVGWQWCWWVAHFQWVFAAMAFNEWQGAEGEDVVVAEVTLEYFGIGKGDGRDKWGCLYVLVGFAVLWRLIGYIFLLIKR